MKSCTAMMKSCIALMRSCTALIKSCTAVMKSCTALMKSCTVWVAVFRNKLQVLKKWFYFLSHIFGTNRPIHPNLGVPVYHYQTDWFVCCFCVCVFLFCFTDWRLCVWVVKTLDSGFRDCGFKLMLSYFCWLLNWWTLKVIAWVYSV